MSSVFQALRSRDPQRRRSLRGSTALVGAGLLLALPVAWNLVAVLSAGPAFAEGGASGGTPGGADSDTGTGTDGANGSGGGAGQFGGAGGSAVGGTVFGGNGGSAAGESGSSGTGAADQGSGGGGGAHGQVSALLPGSPVTGGHGGDGGSVLGPTGTGGGGGAGGAGAVVIGPLPLGVLTSTVTGGNGGNGGNGGLISGAPGDGGTGGAGLIFTSGGSVSIGAAVTGGSGGAGGSGAVGATGAAGAGGVGIRGDSLDLTLGATVSGGMGAGGRALALDIVGGSNSLTLNTGWGLLGGIRVQTGSLGISTEGEATLDNAISGAGTIAKGGTGTLTLTGANTYTGGTLINAGRLSVGTDAALGDAVGALSISGGTLATTASFTSARIVLLNGLGGGFEPAAGTNLTLSGIIVGPGGLIMAGAGTLTLTGANSYIGGTAINAGTLAIGTDMALGMMMNSLSLNGGTLATTASFATSRIILLAGPGSFAPASGTTLTLAGTILGAGGLTVAGAGTLSLTGTGMYTGGTTVSPGATLRLGDGGPLGTILGDVVNNGSLIFNRLSGSSFAGMISGTGSVTKEGGDFSLTGDNTYSGGTIIPGGTLYVGTGGSTGSIGSGPVANDGTLAIWRMGSLTIPGAISGSGVLRQIGPGTTILTGDNSYSGGTVISGGTLQVGNGGTSGTLGTGGTTNDGILVFNRSDSYAYGGAISGTGTLLQAGAGEVILSGTSTYTGATLVGAGRLSVNGSIASSSGVTVLPGATLGGTGQVPGTTVMPGGAIAPGNSIGTLSVSGNLTLSSGATAAFEVGAATADRLDVSGAATLMGNLRLIPVGSSFNFGAPYTLITANSITGTPSVSTQGSFGAGVTAGVSQSPTRVQLTLTPAPLIPTPDSGTITVAPGPVPTTTMNAPGIGGFLPANLRGAGGALDAVRAAGGNLQPFFNVYNAPPGQIGQAVNQLSGEVSTTTNSMGQVAGQQFLSSMLNTFSHGQQTAMGNRLLAAIGSADGDDEAPAAPRPRYAMWGQAMGAYSRVSGEGGAGSATRSSRGYGFAMGLDMAVGAESLVGVSAAGGETHASLSGGLGSSRSWTGQIGTYGRTRLGTPAGGVTLEGAAAVSFLQVESKRTQYFLDNAQQRADYDARAYSFRVEARHDGVTRAAVRLQPFLAVQAQVVDSDGFTERSSAPGTPTGVRAAASTNSTVRTELGGQAEGTRVVAGRSVRGFARLAWAHYLMREQNSASSFIAFPGSGFAVQGARPDTDAALLAVGLETELAPRWTLGARLDSELSGRVREVSGTVRLRYTF